jgi:hypothetical protein
MPTSVKRLKISRIDQGMLFTGPLGSRSPIKVDLSNGDFPFDEDIRAIFSTGGSVIFVDMKTPDGVVTDIPIPAGGIIAILNVTKVKVQDTDAANIVGWPMEH